MSKSIEFLRDLADKLRTQDNRYTSSPNYCIQEHRLITGIDQDYTDQIGWFDNDDGQQADEKKSKALERYYDRYNKEPEGWTRTGYDRQWRHTGIVFLTLDAARAYVTKNPHRHEYEIRVYTNSHYRNPEMREVRRLLAGPVYECVKALELAAQINHYGSVENAKARDAAIAALAYLDTAPEPHK